VTRPAFVLVDRARAEQFALLGTGLRLPSGSDPWTAPDGITWAVRRHGSHVFGVTWLGPGWVFDPYAARQRAETLAAARERMARATPDEHRRQLAAAAGHLRLGRHCERLAWLVHQQVLEAHSSLIKVPDFLARETLWGEAPDAAPRQWRQDLARVLEGLTWLHVAGAMGGGPLTLGTGTALLTHVADLRGSGADVCDERCPGRGGPPHHHYLVNLGRGFLGALEQFGEEDGAGVRAYRFPVGRPRGSGPTLRRVGKAGELISVYLPAKLGDPDVCRSFTAGQHRLLQALVRETTRRPKEKGKGISEVGIVTGNRVPDARGRGKVVCPGLGPDEDHVGFNGNGVRPGLGYYLATPGGWVAKAGGAAGAVEAFLADLAALAGPLGLTVVGVGKSSSQCYDLHQLRAMASAPGLRHALSQVLVRVYTRADYVQRWNSFFGWADVQREPGRDTAAEVLALAGEMVRKGISRRALARGIDADPSFLRRLFRGDKPWPPNQLERAREWVAGYGQATAPPAPCWPPLPGTSGEAPTMLDLALAYRAWGWSVVPQRTGMKKPTVRWKQFQDALPSETQLRRWFARWPDAGLVVVLGPVSGLFVIDVDGEEAHAVLLERLGSEPVAPKVLSGSRKPSRYHLYFRCPPPDVPTKGKATPWHGKLEFRCRGGIVVIPPSLHESGNRYAWAPGRSPADLPLPELPAPVLAALRPRAVPRPSPPVRVDVPSGLDASPSTRQFLSGAYAEGPRWNDRLYRAACDLAGRGVPLEVAEPLLLAGARPWDLDQEARAQATIDSAYGQPRAPGRW
jgi:hypothetical protein